MHIPRSAIGVLFAAATLAACDGTEVPTSPRIQPRVEDAGHNIAQHVSSTTALDETIESPCNGETIHLTGTVREQATYVGQPPLDPENGFFIHGEHSGVITESGTGLTTGAAYDFSDSFHDSFNSPSTPAANFEFTSHETGRLVTQTPGLSLTLRFFIHGIGLPTGEFKVTKQVESVECR